MYGTAFVIISMGISSTIVSLALHWGWLLQQHKLDIGVHVAYAFSSLNAVTDLMLCVAPLPLFWKLQMRVQEKIIVSMLFAVGFL